MTSKEYIDQKINNLFDLVKKIKKSLCEHDRISKEVRVLIEGQNSNQQQNRN
jgi:hypothetical protein